LRNNYSNPPRGKDRLEVESAELEILFGQKYSKNIKPIDLAILLGNTDVVNVLEEIGCKSSNSKKCSCGRPAFLVHNEEFMGSSIAGVSVNVDGLTCITEGFYCFNCYKFV